MSMIDVSGKEITLRQAVVEGAVLLKPETIRAIRAGKIPKGDVLEAARFAGILAAKKTPDLIPLCHPIPIEMVLLDFRLDKNKVRITATVKGRARTGVEMEAFTAAAAAALTVYDMCKFMDREAVIGQIRLMEKRGGKSGDYKRK